jgi:hypothetical protein|tara:strand:+ start:618 stop:797 length:180 start_codon:yes stop_codon:yes gene_type:complete
MKFTIKHGCYTTRYYEVEAKTKRKAENYFWKHLGDLDELKKFTREDDDQILSITEKTDD